MIDPAGTTGAVVSAFILAAVVAFTMIAPRIAGHRLPAAVVAIPTAVLVLVLGLTTWSRAVDEIAFMAPTIGFLAAMLVVADACRRAGLFTWLGQMLAVWSRGSPIGLWRIVFVVAALTTAVLSLDTTVLLLTPVAVATAQRIGARVYPIGLASGHLANTASTLLPVSNLTNLLAISATGIGFLHFTALMAGPWIVGIAVEYAVLRWYLADQLAAPTAPVDIGSTAPTVPRPTPTLVLLGLLLIGFVIADPIGVPLWAVAATGAAIMVAPALLRAPLSTALRVGATANLPFLGFVAALGVIIVPVRTGALGELIAELVPARADLVGLLAVAVLAALAANLLNNLPATLLLVPLVVHQPGLVLAVLLGVNIGPNLGYFGSLANLLWREVMHRDSATPTNRQFLRIGVLTVGATLPAAVIALWLALRIG